MNPMKYKKLKLSQFYYRFGESD